MSSSTSRVSYPIPQSYSERLPTLEQTRHAAALSRIELPSGTAFVRAAWNEKSVWPAQVERTYRFGPPPQLARADGSFPFHWVYVASHVLTSVWEAGLCVNDVTRPGTFYINTGAQNALIATMSFNCPLRFVDISGIFASKLGIYDQIASPDHAWCQWFGARLDELIATLGDDINGIHYMSRRHTGRSAYAISSRAIERLDASRKTSICSFESTPEFFELRDDPSCVSHP